MKKHILCNHQGRLLELLPEPVSIQKIGLPEGSPLADLRAHDVGAIDLLEGRVDERLADVLAVQHLIGRVLAGAGVLDQLFVQVRCVDVEVQPRQLLHQPGCDRVDLGTTRAREQQDF